MILSNECWLKDRCNKVKNNDTSCIDNDIFCMKLFKLNELYRKSNLTNAQRKHIDLYYDKDGTDKDAFIKLKEIENDIVNFVNKGNSLLIQSENCGNGKTSWAIRFIQEYFNKIWYTSDLTCRALFIHVPSYLISLKDSFNDYKEINSVSYIKCNIEKADLVVFDELAIKSATTFEMETLLTMINNRINNNKTNIYTTNGTQEEIYNRLGERLYSRVFNGSQVIKLYGVDKRGLYK